MVCPTCRHELTVKPVPCMPLKEISHAVLELIIDTCGDTERRKKLLRHRDQCCKAFLADQREDRWFGDRFDSVLTPLDRSDGVPRCGNCHWEAHGLVCLQCGARFRNAIEDDMYESDFSEEYRDGAPRRGEEDAYDSNDSFLDTRDIRDINAEAYSGDSLDTDSGVESIDPEQWHGFARDNSMPDVNSHSYRQLDVGSERSYDYSDDGGRNAENWPHDASSDDENLSAALHRFRDDAPASNTHRPLNTCSDGYSDYYSSDDYASAGPGPERRTYQGNRHYDDHAPVYDSDGNEIRRPADESDGYDSRDPPGYSDEYYTEGSGYDGDDYDDRRPCNGGDNYDNQRPGNYEDAQNSQGSHYDYSDYESDPPPGFYQDDRGYDTYSGGEYESDNVVQRPLNRTNAPRVVHTSDSSESDSY